MSFQGAGRIHNRLDGQWSGEGFIQAQPGYGSGCAAAQSGTHGNVTANLDVQGRKRNRTLASQKPKSALDVVLTTEFAVEEAELQPVMTGDRPHRQAQIKLHRDRERVKPGPKFAIEPGTLISRASRSA